MKNEFLITFSKPYEFEGKEFKEVDLSGVKELKVKDLGQIDMQFASGGNFAVMNEMSITYACMVAAKASSKPYEFFENLPAREGIAIKNLVVGFFYV